MPASGVVHLFVSILCRVYVTLDTIGWNVGCIGLFENYVDFCCGYQRAMVNFSDFHIVFCYSAGFMDHFKAIFVDSTSVQSLYRQFWVW